MATPLQQRRDGHAVLIAALDAQGVLDPAWRPVFEAVARDQFIPQTIWRQGPARCEPVTTPEEWRELVYADAPVILQVDDGAKDGPGVATSSNSMPSMTAKMLTLLGVEAGHSILEIGTASGWVAALLCERLGDANVASVEIDRELADRARESLLAAGYTPTVVCRDGGFGLPSRAPYDRIVVTCALESIPGELLCQTVAGGVIVAPLTRRFLSGVLVRLDVLGAREAIGTFHGGASYMPLRAHRPGKAAPVDQSSARVCTSDLDPTLITTLGFSLYASARLPGVSVVGQDDEGALRVWVSDTDGSGATTATNDGVWEYGPRDLWAEVEKVYSEYDALGSPRPEDFRLRVRGREQQLTLADGLVVVSQAATPAGKG